jgi:hypothetical protein
VKLRPRKQLLLKLAGFLLLGAILNVAMAWGCAALIHFKVTRSLPGGIAPTVRWIADNRSNALRIWFLADESADVFESDVEYDPPSWIEWPMNTSSTCAYGVYTYMRYRKLLARR